MLHFALNYITANPKEIRMIQGESLQSNPAVKLQMQFLFYM